MFEEQQRGHTAGAEQAGEGQKVNRAPDTDRPIGHCKGFHFYTKYKGKSLQDSRQRSDNDQTQNFKGSSQLQCKELQGSKERSRAASQEAIAIIQVRNV